MTNYFGNRTDMQIGLTFKPGQKLKSILDKPQDNPVTFIRYSELGHIKKCIIEYPDCTKTEIEEIFLQSQPTPDIVFKDILKYY